MMFIYLPIVFKITYKAQTVFIYLGKLMSKRVCTILSVVFKYRHTF